jgi:Icc-related predicted phosphoesterase
MATQRSVNNEVIRIVLTGDTHEKHRDLTVPPGDLLIHVGDITNFSKRPEVIQDVNTWLGAQPHPYKVLIPGNHDFALEDPTSRGMIDNAVVLINESIEVMGLKIWGSPTTPMRDGAFGTPDDRERARIFSLIPDNTDIVITHGPPLGLLDQTMTSKEHLGCVQLLNAVCRVRPTLHVFGHVHAGHGTTTFADILFVNASLAGPDGSLSHPPTVVDVEMPKG